ncbi:Orotate phosphoribosyltransferase [compost metagenome]
MLAIFSYQLDKAVNAFREAGIKIQSLSNYTALIDVAMKKGTIQEQDLELLKSWREDPSSFGN